MYIPSPISYIFFILQLLYDLYFIESLLLSQLSILISSDEGSNLDLLDILFQIFLGILIGLQIVHSVLTDLKAFKW